MTEARAKHETDGLVVEMIYEQPNHGPMMFIKRQVEAFRYKLATSADWRGWLICFAVLVVTVVRSGVTYSFGVFVVELEKKYKKSMLEANWVGTLSFTISLSCAPVSVVMIRLIGYRGYQVTGVLGISMLTLSCMFSSLTQTVEMLFLTHSLMYGVGSSMILMASSLIIGEYFESGHKRHVLATSILLSGYPLGSLIFNPINALIVEKLGWRNGFRISGMTIFFTGGLACYNFLSKNEMIEQFGLNEFTQLNQDPAHDEEHGRVRHKIRTTGSIDSEYSRRESIETPTVKTFAERQQKDGVVAEWVSALPAVTEGGAEKHFPLPPKRPPPPKLKAGGKQTTFRQDTITSMDSRMSGESYRTYKRRKMSVGLKVQEISYTNKWDLFRQALPTCELRELRGRKEIILWLLANLLTYLGFYMPFLNLPYYMEIRGIHTDRSSWALTLLSLAECVSYIGASLLGDRLKGRLVYVNMIACASLAILCYSWPGAATSFGTILVLSSAMGFFLGLTIVYSYAESGEVTLLPIDTAWAHTNMWSGLGILVSPLCSGWIFDLRKSYDDVFYTNGAIYTVACILFLLIIWLMHKRKGKEQFNYVEMAEEDETSRQGMEKLANSRRTSKAKSVSFDEDIDTTQVIDSCVAAVDHTNTREKTFHQEAMDTAKNRNNAPEEETQFIQR